MLFILILFKKQLYFKFNFTLFRLSLGGGGWVVGREENGYLEFIVIMLLIVFFLPSSGHKRSYKGYNSDGQCKRTKNNSSMS